MKFCSALLWPCCTHLFTLQQAFVAVLSASAAQATKSSALVAWGQAQFGGSAPYLPPTSLPVRGTKSARCISIAGPVQSPSSAPTKGIYVDMLICVNIC